MESSLEFSVVEHPLSNQSSFAASQMINIMVQSATEARVNSHSSSLVFLQGEGNKEMPSLMSGIWQMCSSGSIKMPVHINCSILCTWEVYCLADLCNFFFI